MDVGLSGSLSWILLARLCPASFAGLFYGNIAHIYKLIPNQPFVRFGVAE
jgi:hypothetical protein